MICKQCNKEFHPNTNGSPAKYCCSNCRKKASREYNADNIKVLNDSQLFLDPRFDWKLSEELSKEYKKSSEWIARSIKACREAGESPEYFINRYLKKQDTPINLLVDKASRQIQKDATWRDFTGR